MNISPQDVLTAALSQKEALDQALLNDKALICLECKQIVGSVFKGVCPGCEWIGERQQEMDKFND